MASPKGQFIKLSTCTEPRLPFLLLLRLAVFLVILALPTPALAESTLVQTVPADTLNPTGSTLSAMVEYAYQHNPAIEAARQGWRAAVQRVRVVTALPDPELSYRYLTDTVGSRTDPRNIEITITQSVPFPGKLSKEGNAATADARIARLEFDRMVRDTVVQVRESFHELQYIREARRIADGNLAILSQLEALISTAYAAKQATFVDVSKALSQKAQLQYDILLLQELEETEIARLNALLNRPADAAIGPLAQEPLCVVGMKIDDLYKLAEEYREEIGQGTAQIEKAEAQVDRALLGYLPDFKIGIFMEDVAQTATADEPNPDNDAFGIVAGLSIPLWIDKNQGRFEEARAEVKKARAERQNTVNNTRSGIRSIYFRLRNAERLVQLYETSLLPQAATAMETAESWYRAGQGSLTDFVETQSVWYAFQLALARAQADHGRALARLEQLVGQSLDPQATPPVMPGEEKP